MQKEAKVMKESRNLEFKSDMTNTFLKTVSAYANFGTGTIEFGRFDNGEIKGIDDPDKFCLDIENKINDSIQPKPDYSLKVNRNKKLVILTVHEGRYKPYFYKGKAYRRSDTATVEVDQLELKRLALEGSNMYFEELPCKETKLSFTYFESKLKEKLDITKITDDMLRTLGFFNEDKKYTIAASLFADKNSFYGIDYARFGKNISEILDRDTFTNCSILKQYDDIISAFRRYYQYEEIQGFERRTVDRIPEEAFREAVANALVHRTWDINAHVKVSMYDDKIVITSPGGLPKGLSKEEYISGNISYLRNPIIGNVFFRLGYIEMFGTGIGRILTSYELFSNKPVFEVFDNSISITLPIISLNYSVTTEGEELLNVLSNELQLSSAEIAKRVGWSKDKTIRTLNALKSAGYIEVYGKARGTKYAKR